MKLYYSPGACSLSPHIVAEEAGIPLELEKVDLQTHKTEHGQDFYAVNPKGYIPALQLDDGTVLSEGPVIVQYLADLKPASGLAPANGTLERYKLQEWLTFINSEIHKSFSPLFGGGSDEVKNDAIAKIGKRMTYVNEQLADRHYLLGDTFTAADAYMFVMLTWAHHMKLDMSAYSNLHAYFARIAGRAKVHSAMKAEGLVK
jgi:glutathione S-transferase